MKAVNPNGSILEAMYFTFNNHTYGYFPAFGPSGLNERIIEIPIAYEYANIFSGKKILEVGKVLSTYMQIDCDMVDLTEKAPGVLNIDIMDYLPDKKYDLILCLSTIEHIGYGDYDKEINPNKCLKAINHMIELLSQNGLLVTTAPIGWNPTFDEALVQKSLPFTEIYYMKRKSRGIWYQTDYLKAINSRYGYPFPYANALMIGTYKNKGE